MREQFTVILNRLLEWEDQGKSILKDETTQICQVPHVGNQAWLHTIYGPLDIDRIHTMEAELGMKFPCAYREFLQIANGMNIFSDSLSIWGYRRSYERTGDAAVQPYSIIDENDNKPDGDWKSWLFFGSYSWDGSLMGFDLNSGSDTVYLVSYEDPCILREWSNFIAWLDGEVDRLSGMFDEAGKVIDDEIPTVPKEV